MPAHFFKNPEKNIVKVKKNKQMRTPGVSTSHMMELDRI